MRENEAKNRLGLGSLDGYPYARSQHIQYIYIYQCVNELIYHISIHGAMCQWCELT